MVYKRTSAQQDNIVRIDVLWDVTITCSIPTACGGDLPHITTTATRDVTVGEILAVNTYPPGIPDSMGQR